MSHPQVAQREAALQADKNLAKRNYSVFQGGMVLHLGNLEGINYKMNLELVFGIYSRSFSHGNTGSAVAPHELQADVVKLPKEQSTWRTRSELSS